jgi:hypothetical protein
MPEWNTRPANHYLPRRVTASVGAAAREARELGKAADDAAREKPGAT